MSYSSGVNPHGVPTIAHSRCSFDGGFRVPPNPDRYQLLLGLRKEDGVANLEELSGVVDYAVAPESPKEVDGFVEDLPPPLEFRPQKVEFLLDPSRSDAQDSPPVGELVDCRGLLPDQDRIALGED